MPLTIKIEDATVESQEVNGPRGKFTSQSQKGICELSNGERRIVRLRVQRETGPLGVGLYTISDKSFGVGQYGDLEIARLVLVPARSSSSQSGGGSAVPAVASGLAAAR